MMEIEQHALYALAAVLLFALGFHGLLSRRHLLRKIIAVNVMSSGVFLLLIAVARRDAVDFPDPVPQAMVLTGIVVAISISALAMALARRIYRQTGGSTLYAAEEEPQREEAQEE
jgi:multicomponent Na+:H+ antiporter subunit C